MIIHIDPKKCTGCGACIIVCPFKAISLVKNTAQIDQTICTYCQKCIRACPFGAISTIEASMIYEQENPIPKSKGQVEIIESEPISINIKEKASKGISPVLKEGFLSGLLRVIGYSIGFFLDKRMNSEMHSSNRNSSGSIRNNRQSFHHRRRTGRK